MPAINISRKFLLIISLIYIYLPITFFLFGWTKPYVAMACLSVLYVCAVRCLKQAKAGRDLTDKGPKNFRIGLGTLELVLLFLIWIGYYAGYGRFTDQAFDWFKHNAILADLVNRPWPVYYENGGEHSMLTYYIAQYIVPALIGKAFNSFRYAEVALYVWNVAGLFLVYLHIVSFIQAKRLVSQLACAAAIPFFSLPVWFSRLILKHFTGTGNDFLTDTDAVNWYYYTDTIKIQYFDNFFHLRWTFPQVITIWLIIMLLLEYKHCIKYYVIIMLPAILYSTFSFLGMLPLALGFLLEELIRKKGRGIFFQVFSFENISATLTAGLFFLLYLYGNVAGKKPDGINFHLMPYGWETLAVYAIFVAVNVLVYFLVLFRDHKSDGIFYAGFGTLILLPLFSMGMYNDLLTRASIPALFIVMIYVLLFLKDQYLNGNDSFLNSKKVAICLVFLLVGSCYPFAHFSSRVTSEDYHSLGRGNDWASLECFANRASAQRDDMKFNYYSYDLDSNLFYKYIASDNIR